MDDATQGRQQVHCFHRCLLGGAAEEGSSASAWSTTGMPSFQKDVFLTIRAWGKDITQTRLSPG